MVVFFSPADTPKIMAVVFGGTVMVILGLVDDLFSLKPGVKFLVQFIASLWVPFYNRVDPTWIGIPFFYWYQMLWVIIGAVLTAIVYFATDA